jgi:pimeloyl-ACP methyl ester carboxylesterase
MIDPILSSDPTALRPRLIPMHKPAWQRRLNLAFVIIAGCAAAWPILGSFTKHPGETMILLMPPALGAFLWFGWPRVRRTPWRKYALYLVTLAPILAGAEYLVAQAAHGRLLWVEVFWAVYFTVGLRLAWTGWSWTVGRAGERWRRWGRRMRRRGPNSRTEWPASRRTLATATRLIGPGRAMLTLLVFVPLAVGLLVHRIKIGDRNDPEGRAFLPVEAVSFRSADGLNLSGWFLEDPGSDASVVICHGSGANKSNFVEFMRVFRFQGYNCLIFDFRGHGDSEGHTCTFGLFEDADVRAAVDWLKTNRPERARHIYGLGSSMGAACLARAAAKDDRIEAVVLDSCFASIPLLLQQHLGFIPLIGPAMAELIPAAMSLQAGQSIWKLDTREAVRAISPRPILFIHGTGDVFIPRINMEILYGCATGPKEKWLGPGPHSNIVVTDFETYRRKVIAFFDGVAKSNGH